MLLENEGEILAMTEMETYSGQSPIIVNNDDKVISLDISALSAQLSGFDTFTGVSADSTLTGDGKTSALGVNMIMLTGMLSDASAAAVQSAQDGLVRDITFEMQNIGVFSDTRSSTNPDGSKNLYYHWTVERADCSGDGLTSNLDTSNNTNYISLNTSAKEALSCVVTNSSVWNNASAGNIEVNTVVENNSATWNEVTNKLDITSFSTVSGDFYPYSNPSGFITGVDLSNYYTKSETSGASELADAFSNIPTGDPEVNSAVKTNSATWNDVTNKLDTTAFSDVSGSFYTNDNPSGFITGVDLSDYYTKNETSGADELANAFNNIPAGDEEVNNTVHTYSGDWNSTYITVHSNSASWGQCVSFTGVTTDATLTGDGLNNPLGVADTQTLSSDQSISITTAVNGVILGVNSSWFDNAVNSAVTGTQGDAEVNAAVHNNSATWNTVTNKLDTTAFSTVSGDFYPYSNPSGFITGVDLTNYYTKSETSGASELADAFSNLPTGDEEVNLLVHSNSGVWNDVTGKENTITFGYSAGAVSSINGSAILGETIPYEVYGISAGDNITIWENNNALWISAGVEGSTYTGDVQGALNEVYTNSSVWLTAHQDISTKLDTTAFSDVSGTFLTAHQSLDDYATKNYVQTNSAVITAMIPTDYYPNSNPSGFITGVDLSPYQTTAGMTAYATTGDISATEWNSVYETVETNSGSWTGTSVESYNLSAGDNIQINKDDVNSAIGIAVTGLNEYQTTAGMTGYATTGDLNYVSGVVGDVETLLASL